MQESNNVDLNNTTEKFCEICLSSEHATIDHSEKGESGIEFVSAEKLIPNINTSGLYNGESAEKFRQKIEQESHRGAHRPQFTPYSWNFSISFRYILENIDKERRTMKILNRFKDQVVVDLGAGIGRDIYPVLWEIGAKGYIGVDLWRGRELKSALKERLYCDGFRCEKKDGLIPAVAIEEDILSFLKRLPDKSVSITAFGLGHGIIPRDYKYEVAEEIKRVLDPKGVMIVDEGGLYADVIINHLEVSYGGIDESFYAYVNLTNEQELELAQILDTFWEEIKGMNSDEIGAISKQIRQREHDLIESFAGDDEMIEERFNLFVCRKKEGLINKRREEIRRWG